jgi:hypothetical protein
MLHTTPQLSALPRPRSGCVESIGYCQSVEDTKLSTNKQHSRFTALQPATRMRSGACMLDTYVRIAPTHNLLDRILSQATWAALRSDAAIKARRRPPRDSASRHPCRQAASFLPCASQPPDACRVYLARPRQRLRQGSRDRRAFVSTRSGFDTMARRHQDTDDEITEADNTAGAATFGGAPTRGPRQFTPLSMPADLRTSLAMPTTFGPKLFEITALHAVSVACKVKVKDARDLVLLRDWLFEDLGPPYMWTVMLSVVEWEHLTDDKKEMHRTMRESWLSSYSKASHTVLQDWLWRFLKKQTESFAPLHKVFAKIKVDSPDSGTSAWTEIFLLCVFITAGPSTKLCAWGGGAYWGTCATRDDEPRPVWTSLPITH